jgi:hypothetical protein
MGNCSQPSSSKRGSFRDPDMASSRHRAEALFVRQYKTSKSTRECIYVNVRKSCGTQLSEPTSSACPSSDIPTMRVPSHLASIAFLGVVIYANRKAMKSVYKDIRTQEQPIKEYVKKRATALRYDKLEQRFSRLWNEALAIRLQRMRNIDWERMQKYIPQHAKRASDRVIATLKQGSKKKST